jgi:hypothetical protein
MISFHLLPGAVEIFPKKAANISIISRISPETQLNQTDDQNGINQIDQTNPKN